MNNTTYLFIAAPFVAAASIISPISFAIFAIAVMEITKKN